jgi:hypothetical protein
MRKLPSFERKSCESILKQSNETPSTLQATVGLLIGNWRMYE